MQSWGKLIVIMFVTAGLAAGCDSGETARGEKTSSYGDERDYLGSEFDGCELGEDELDGDSGPWVDSDDEDFTIAGDRMNVVLGKSANLEGVFFTNGWPGASIPVGADKVASDGEFFGVSHEWDMGTIWWSGSNPYLVIDLEDSYAIESVVVQADDNDSYLLSYHVPGTPDDEWVPLSDVLVVDGWGMQTRDEHHLPELVQADALRFEAVSGDNLYSVGEIQAFGYALMSCGDIFNVAMGNQTALEGDFFSNGWDSAHVPADTDYVVTNDSFFPVSHEWDVETIWWSGLEPYLVIDLNGEFSLTELVVQADDNDSYLVSYHVPGSPDDEWVALYEVPVVGGWGMQTREPFVLDAPVLADALRFNAVSGDNWYSVGEIQAFGTVGCNQ